MKKKSAKVGETAAPYAAKKVAQGEAARKDENSGVRYMDDATFSKASDKVFKVHEELFRKLAQ